MLFQISIVVLEKKTKMLIVYKLKDGQNQSEMLTWGSADVNAHGS